MQRPLSAPLRLLTWILPLALAAPAAAFEVRAPKAADGAAGRVVRTLAARIGAEVARLRGLRFSRPVEVGVHDDASLRRFAEAELRRNGGAAAQRAQSDAWVRLGLLPPGADLLRDTLALLQAQVAGFYVPGGRALRIARGLVPLGPQWPNPLHLLTGSPEDKLAFVMAHELVHAVGDQRWNLKRLTRERRGETDVEIAVACLVEGDATIGGLAYAMAERSGAFDISDLFLGGGQIGWILEAAMKLARRGLLPDGGGLDRAPAALAERLVFPYVGGTRLALAAGDGGPRSEGGSFPPGWDGVDDLYRDPPRSTEQVLHPERLLEVRDDPQRLTLRVPARLLPRGARLRWHDILGELMVRTLLRAGLAEAEADAAADGWDGDLLLHWRARAGQDALVWLSVWDSADEARQAEAALRRRFDPPGDVHIQRLGDAVVLVRSDDMARSVRLADHALRHHRRRPAPSVR